MQGSFSDILYPYLKLDCVKSADAIGKWCPVGERDFPFKFNMEPVLFPLGSSGKMQRSEQPDSAEKANSRHSVNLRYVFASMLQFRSFRSS